LRREATPFQRIRPQSPQRPWAPAEKIEDAGFAEAAYSAAGFQEIPEIFWSGLIDRGRSDGSELREEAGGFCERFGELRIFRSVLGGKLPMPAAVLATSL